MASARPNPEQEIKIAWRWIRTNWTSLLVLLVVAAAGLPIIEHTTNMGIGLRDDSFSYFAGADGLLTGNGYARFSELNGWKPLTNFPPLYSVLLAVPQFIGVEATAGSRLIAGLSFAATAFLASLLTYRSTQSLSSSLLVSGLLLLSPSLLEVNSWALSEGPYLVLMIGALLLMTLLVESEFPGWLLIGANVFFLSLATLTRYAGVTLLGLSAAAILLLRNDRDRIKLSLGIPVASALPLGIFLGRNLLTADNTTNRPIPFWHPPESENWLAGARTLAGWVLPQDWLKTESVYGHWWVIIAAFLLLAVLLLTISYFRPSKGTTPNLSALSSITVKVLLAHWWLYFAFILLSVSFFDRLIPLNPRILAPLQITLVLLFSHFLEGQVALLKKMELRQALRWTAVFSFLASQTLRALPVLDSLSSTGMGFNSPIWRSARIFEIIDQLPDGPIYTNNVPSMYFLADRYATYIPARYDPASNQTRQDYQDELAQMHSRLSEQDGFLILIGWPPENRVPPEHLTDLTTGLNLFAKTEDGLIYCLCP